MTNRFALVCALALGLALPALAADDKKASDAAVAELDKFIAEQKIDKSAAGWKTKLPKPPKVEFAADKVYYWEMKTNKGDMVFQLLHKTAPMHVSSTIYLTRLGFYDGVPFHRVIQGFMAQGGDPLGKGFGGPGYQYGGEFDSSVKHDKRGMLSMANAGPNTDGSQFFITFGPTPHLDGRHSVFGRVVEGMDVVTSIRERDPQRDREPGDRIETIEIEERAAGE